MPVLSPLFPEELVESGSTQAQVVNVASVAQRSPFRYPGGKTWLIPELKQWLTSMPERPATFIEPFAGGGIASLTAVMDGLADRAIMCELDPAVAAVWRTILDDGEWLAQTIQSFPMGYEAVQILLATPPLSDQQLAFQTIVRNRVQHGGILARGASMMRQGENGKGLLSRWYPKTLAMRILCIYKHRHQIEFVEGDGLELVKLHQQDSTAAFFVDPPYTAGGKRAGKRLYTYNEIDHAGLFDLLSGIRGKVLITYDEAPEVIELAAQSGRFTVDRIPMKNTHHATMYELLIKNAN